MGSAFFNVKEGGEEHGKNHISYFSGTGNNC